MNREEQAFRDEEARRRRIERAMVVYATDDETRLRGGADETDLVTAGDGEVRRLSTDGEDPEDAEVDSRSAGGAASQN